MKFTWVLTTVFVFFCLLLIVCYAIAEQAHPIFVDMHGHPTNAGTAKY